MESRGRGMLKLHLRPSETDRWLDELGLYRKRIARDSSCLFRALSENIYNSQQHHIKVRQDCVKFMAENRSLFEGYVKIPFDLYLNEMLKPSEWGTLTEVLALSHLYRKELIIFEANKESTCLFKGYGNPIFLFYSEENNHFDVIYPKDYINDSSLCQSIIYQVLYENVFEINDLKYAVDKMLYDKAPSQHVQYLLIQNVDKDSEKLIDEKKDSNMLSLKCKHQSGHVGNYKFSQDILSIVILNRKYIHLESICILCLNLNSAKDLLDNGIIPFPYKVAKALDSTIYRNIEYDVWIEKRKEQRYGAKYYDGTTLQVGAKCLCRLSQTQEVPYHCHIQQLDQNGPCIVFIEELGEKQVVAFEQLESLPRDQLQPWTPPYRYSRIQSQFLTISQVLQQLGNINSKGYKNCKGKPETCSEETYLKPSPPLLWDDDISNVMKEDPDFLPQPMAYCSADTLNFTTLFHHFVPISPVEVTALPLMVDCRGPTASAAEEKPEANAPAANNAAAHAPQQPDNHHNQGTSSELCLVTPTAAIPPVPAVTGQITHHNYTAPGMGYGYGMYPPPYVYGGGAGFVKGGVVWCGAPPPLPPPAPHAPHLPHLPPGVNPHVYKSVQPNGSDLPMNDMATLRYYFNLGVECAFTAGYGPPQHVAHLARPYTHHDLTQDMAHMGVSERSVATHDHKSDKHSPHNNAHNMHKGNNAQRPMLGPRFKRNNYEGNQNMNQNKSYNNNNMNNKGGPNNRRNSQPDSRPVSQGPFTEYEPGAMYSQIYPPYYPIESDLGMMGMTVGGVGGVAYPTYGGEEGAEYVPHYYPPHYPPPPAHPALPAMQPPPPQQPPPNTHNNEHKN